MFKNMLLFILFVFCSVTLSAETIFIYTVSEGTDSTLKESVPYLEDGILDELFEAGHIIFNASSTRAVTEKGLDSYKEPEDFLIAKSGGASFLMEIALHYRIEDEKEVPVSADYRLFNVISGKLLKNGTRRMVQDDGEEKTSEERLTDMGRSIVFDLLSFL